MKLWNGRFEGNTDSKTDLYNASITFDIKLLPYDVQASIAHIEGLVVANILTTEEKEQLKGGLNKVLDDYNNNSIIVEAGDEDVHMLIERLLTEDLGEIGKKVHTGRSRNDQVAVATRLYTIDNLKTLKYQLEEWINCLDSQSKKYYKDIMAGCTHMQSAQPITLGFWFDAYKQMFIRDLQKVDNAIVLSSECPLGSAALAGTSYNLDRSLTSKELGFNKPTDNSMDSVADRDYIIDSLYVCSLVSVHLSKISEEIITFNTQIYNYLTLDDMYSTGSSIMPQKKNPDIAELARGKSARMIGNLTQMLTLIKGTPLAYNKDFQEDKEALFDSFENTILALKLFKPMIETATFNLKKMKNDCEFGYINATDLADYLVGKGVTFRDSHHIVGTLVKFAENKSIALDEIRMDQFNEICDLIEDDIYEFIQVENCLMRRQTYGAPGWFVTQIENQK